MLETILAFIMSLVMQFLGGSSVDMSPVNIPLDEPISAEVLSVTDGDTIKVRIDGRTETVRYIGIDTPEPYRDGEPACYSKQATERNQMLVEGKVVQLVADAEDRDRYDRLLRYVYVDEELVNEILVAEGFATTLTIKPNTAMADRLDVAESNARDAGVGLWSACGEQNALEEPSARNTVTAGAIEVLTTELSDGQRQVLEFIGIDTTSITITQEMIRCGQNAVGVERLAEITSGDTPSIMEGVRLTGCYR